MQKSESIAELAKALSQAQAEFETAKKDSENPFFNSKYADITSVFEACRAQLAKHGLAVSQPFTFDEEGVPVVTTILMHSSGEWLSGNLKLKPTKPDPQGVGSALTYGRRYSLEGILGIAREDEDDDGNAASERPAEAVIPPSAEATADQGGEKQKTPPPPPVSKALTVEEKNALMKDLNRLLQEFGDRTDRNEGEALQWATEKGDFKGFKDIFKMKYSWQFENAKTRIMDELKKLDEMDADDIP